MSDTNKLKPSRQIILSAFFTIVPSTLFFGISKITAISMQHIVYISFLLLFRLKMLLDDLEQSKDKNGIDYKDFILGGLVPWSSWILAASKINHLTLSYLFCMSAFIIASFWLIFKIFQGHQRERNCWWLYFNWLYIGGLVSCYNNFRPTISVIFLILVCIVDAIKSESYKSL